MDAPNHRVESLEVPPYSSGYGTSVPGATCSYSEPYGAASEEESGIDPEVQPLLQKRVLDKEKARKKKLGMIFGVTIPCILSIFSYLLFLRLGFVVGQAGYLETLAMLLLGYAVVVLTVLSISAIATNGNVEGGGVYFMISRALGPEFGGSVGIIFFITNIFASATYVIAFVEALQNSVGAGGVGSLIPCEDHNGADVRARAIEGICQLVRELHKLTRCVVLTGADFNQQLIHPYPYPYPNILDYKPTARRLQHGQIDYFILEPADCLKEPGVEPWNLLESIEFGDLRWLIYKILLKKIVEILSKEITNGNMNIEDIERINWFLLLLYARLAALKDFDKITPHDPLLCTFDVHEY